MKRISIIIPVKEINDYIHEAMEYYKVLDYDNFEILIFPDNESSEIFDNTRIIASGAVGPAEKRDMALKYATGELFAFIDDDAFPRSDWLKNAVRHFDDDAVGAVGGPAVTPDADEILRQASGKVYENPLCSGGYTYRYKPGKLIEADDIPSVNLIVRRDVFEQVGGFDSTFYPGEDTKLCLDITKNLHKKIIYDPDVLVWHHRRTLFAGHLKQTKNYAQHRGYFAKKLPQTSLKIAYFVPTIFTFGLILGPFICLALPVLWYAYLGVLLLYILLLIGSTITIKPFKLQLLTIAGIFTTHITYGTFLVIGLFSRKLIR